MYNVYWMRGQHTNSSLFPSDKMGDAIKFMEVLRTLQRNGEMDVNGDKVSFITFCSENPDSVAIPGVDVVGPDYDWKKRRI